jgi:proteic killer suppression protein
MIRSYKDKKTQRFAEGERVPQFEPFRKQAEKRLRVLEAATTLRDLAQIRSNRLEALVGDREGQYSIRINKQWRICFEWPFTSDGPESVEIIDYH